MEDFGDYFYIIAMLAAFVFSIFKKQKKAKQNVPAPHGSDQPSYDPTQEEDILEDLRELFQSKEEQRPKATVQKQAPQATPLHMRNKPSVQSPVSKPKQPIFEDNAIEDEEIGFEFEKEEIDLRQAVIYSEILRRPYQ